MRTNQCTIANKEVGVATHLTQTLNLIDMARTGNILNTSKVKDVRPFSSLNHVNPSIAIKSEDNQNGKVN